MMQVIENHAQISGELLSAEPDPDRPGFLKLQVRVLEARNVDDWPNLFARDVGTTIPVIVREGSVAAEARPGPVILRVKKTGPGMSFADE
jgi:hypothetical protein